MEQTPVKTKTGKVIKYEYIPAEGVWNYTIWDGNRHVGTAIVIRHEKFKATIDEDEEIFMNIIIFNEEDRRKGIATELMKFVTDYGNHIALISSALDNRGRDFAFKTGWKIKKSLKKKENDIMYFKREVDNATS
ncbi:MAG TPA: GNAT family N-acetyltransferase [Anaerolineae bacterium]|nr:GNAT family N-acetyltransferase [Anaerolineae bacterium]